MINTIKFLIIAILTFISFSVIADTQRLKIVSRERNIEKLFYGKVYIILDTKTQCEYMLIEPLATNATPTMTLMKCPKD